jgi:sarcosine oxidase, subunit beta
MVVKRDRGMHVCVVGAGAVGLAAALRAAELGAKSVTVVEQAHPAAGSSGLSAGIFNRQSVDPLDINIRVAAERLLSRLSAEDGLPLVRCGYVRLAHSDQQLDAFEAALAVERSLGVTDASLLTSAELARLIPGMYCGDLAGGLYGASDGHLDGHLLCGTLAARATRLGVQLRSRTQLVGAEPRKGGYHLVTTAGVLGTDLVINAAGAWATKVAGLFDEHVPLMSQRHQVCQVSLSQAAPYRLPVVQEYVPGTAGLAPYFREEGPAQLIAGLHTHQAMADASSENPDSYRRQVDADYVEEVAAALHHRMPALAGPAIAGGWSGLYPLSPDGNPQIGPHSKQPTLVAACGGGGVGLTLGLIYGQLAAEWAVLGEPVSIAGTEIYLPDRVTLQATTQLPRHAES